MLQKCVTLHVLMHRGSGVLVGPSGGSADLGCNKSADSPTAMWDPILWSEGWPIDQGACGGHGSTDLHVGSTDPLPDMWGLPLWCGTLYIISLMCGGEVMKK